MKPIDLKLDPAVVVKGAMYDSSDPRFLREDLLEIDLPSGLVIAVGWEPHCDPKGSYRIVLFRDFRTEVLEEFETKNLDDALRIIKELTDRRLYRPEESGRV